MKRALICLLWFVTLAQAALPTEPLVLRRQADGVLRVTDTSITATENTTSETDPRLLLNGARISVTGDTDQIGLTASSPNQESALFVSSDDANTTATAVARLSAAQAASVSLFEAQDASSAAVFSVDGAGDLFTDGTTTFGGVEYTWPGADGTSGQVLSTNASGALSWVTRVINAFVTITADTGSTVANSPTDTLNIVGGTDISTSITGDTLTIDFSGTGGPSAANPTAEVDGTAVNGVATTFMRSDAAPALADPLTPADGTQNITGALTTSGDLTAGGDLISSGGSGSFQAGINAAAASTNATAVGDDSVAGFYGTALGHGAEAGNRAVALGRNTDASGTNSLAIGNEITVTGTNSIGILGGATENNTVLIGQGSQANTGTGSVVVGNSNFSRGNNNVVFGESHSLGTGADRGVVLGYDNTIGAVDDTVTIGSNITNSTANRMHLGTSSQHLWLPGDFRGQAGLYALNDVGVGTSSPSARLHVDTGTTEGHEAIRIQQDDADQAFFDFVGTSSGDGSTSITTANGNGTVVGPKSQSSPADTYNWSWTGMVQVEINNIDRWIPYYTLSINSPACPRIDAWVDGEWVEVGRAVRHRPSREDGAVPYSIYLDRPAQKFRLVEDEPETSRIYKIRGDGERWMINGKPRYEPVITTPARPGMLGAIPGRDRVWSVEFEFSNPVWMLETFGWYDLDDVPDWQELEKAA